MPLTLPHAQGYSYVPFEEVEGWAPDTLAKIQALKDYCTKQRIPYVGPCVRSDIDTRAPVHVLLLNSFINGARQLVTLGPDGNIR